MASKHEANKKDENNLGKVEIVKETVGVKSNNREKQRRDREAKLQQFAKMKIKQELHVAPEAEPEVVEVINAKVVPPKVSLPPATEDKDDIVIVNSIFKCPECFLSFNKEPEYTHHITKVHVAEIAAKIKTETISTKAAEIAKVLGKEINCDKCDAVFGESGDYEMHTKFFHGSRSMETKQQELKRKQPANNLDKDVIPNKKRRPSKNDALEILTLVDDIQSLVQDPLKMPPINKKLDIRFTNDDQTTTTEVSSVSKVSSKPKFSFDLPKASPKAVVNSQNIPEIGTNADKKQNKDFFDQFHNFLAKEADKKKPEVASPPQVTHESITCKDCGNVQPKSDVSFGSVLEAKKASLKWLLVHKKECQKSKKFNGILDISKDLLSKPQL